MKHYLDGEKGNFATFETFDKDKIKEAIIKRLTEVPDDLVIHYKDCEDKKQVADLVDMYEVNPKNGKPSLIIQKGNRSFYKPLI